MSLTKVQQYFLRVGRSSYKSDSFQWERAQLAKDGIDFDACSQFGIGFLACFMLADNIRVETWAHGSEPIEVQLTGPSKYFTIKRLPDAQRLIPFLDDGSQEVVPGRPSAYGTTITLFLNNSVEKGAIAATLEQLAVNIETPVTISEPKRKQVVPTRAWARSGILSLIHI